MEIAGYLTPDESSSSESSISSFDTTFSFEMSDSETTSDSETFSSVLEQYPRVKQVYDSLYPNTTNNYQRLFQLSPQHNDECPEKLDSIIESEAEILQLLKLLKEMFSKRNEQNENLGTMNNFWDKKWHQASAAYTNMRSALMHIKGTNDMTESKLNAILMKLQGFVQDDFLKLKQNSDECVAKNIVIEETVHKFYNAVLNLNEVYCSKKSSDAVKTELARNVNDTNIRVKNMENLLIDIKKQLDNNSKLDNMEKALVTPSVQQHYLLNRSCPTLPCLHYSRKTAITPLNNSFHHVNSSHTKVDEKYGNMSFMSTHISNQENSFHRKQFPDKLLKQNTPPFCIKLDKNSNDSIGVSHNSVSEGVSFDNILSGSESKMDESRMFHEEANKSPKTTACSKEPSVLQSGDKKRGLNKNILTTRSANHDHMVCTSNEQNVFMSEETVGSMQEKLKDCSPRVQSIYNEQPDISYGEAISPAVTSASDAQRPAIQQNQHHKGKKRDSKENSLNTPLESPISPKVSNPQLHVRSNIQMLKKNVKLDSPSISSISGRKRPCYFRTKDSPKLIKTPRESVYDFDL